MALVTWQAWQLLTRYSCNLASIFYFYFWRPQQVLHLTILRRIWRPNCLGSMTLLLADLHHPPRHCVIEKVFIHVRSSRVYFNSSGKDGGPGYTKTGAKVEVIANSLAIQSAKLFPFYIGLSPFWWPGQCIMASFFFFFWRGTMSSGDSKFHFFF